MTTRIYEPKSNSDTTSRGWIKVRFDALAENIVEHVEVPSKSGYILEEFLPFYMQTDQFWERALMISEGSMSPTIKWKTLAQQEFVIPPKDEQRRIADILWAADEIVSKLNNCIQKAEQFRRDFLSQIILGSFKHTKFQDTAIGPLPSTWQFAPIANVGNVQLGRQRAPQYQTGEYSRPYLRVANVFDGYLNLEDVLQMDFDDHDYKKYKLCPGDILLNEGQSRELVGRSCIYLGEIEGCCFQNTLIRFQSSDQLLPEFAFGYFQHNCPGPLERGKDGMTRKGGLQRRQQRQTLFT